MGFLDNPVEHGNNFFKKKRFFILRNDFRSEITSKTRFEFFFPFYLWEMMYMIFCEVWHILICFAHWAVAMHYLNNFNARRLKTSVVLHFEKRNSTQWKYRWIGFIWMIVPKNFVHRNQSWITSIFSVVDYES